jgi:hypothetical protein
VDRDLLVYGDQIKVGGIIQGDATLNGKNLYLADQTLIKGNLATTSRGGGTHIASTVQVMGMKKVIQKIPVLENMKQDFLAIINTGKILGFLGTIVFALLLVIIAPNYIKNVNATITNRPLVSIGTGLLLLFLVPIVIIFCLISIIGIPIGLILFFAYSMGIYSAKIFVSIWLGATLLTKLQKTANPSLAWSLILGTIIYTLLLKIPFFGWLIGLTGLLLGLGALLIAKKEFIRQLRQQAIL